MWMESLAVSNYIVHTIKKEQKVIPFATAMYIHIHIFERRL